MDLDQWIKEQVRAADLAADQAFQAALAGDEPRARLLRMKHDRLYDEMFEKLDARRVRAVENLRISIIPNQEGHV